MKNHGFEIKVNDEKICRAGLDVDYYVVSCDLISKMRKNDECNDVSIQVGGLNSLNMNHVNWITRDLKKGDKVCIEIIDENFDEPSEITIPNTEEFALQERIKLYYKLKEELKEHLNE